MDFDWIENEKYRLLTVKDLVDGKKYVCHINNELRDEVYENGYEDYLSEGETFEVIKNNPKDKEIEVKINNIPIELSYEVILFKYCNFTEYEGPTIGEDFDWVEDIPDEVDQDLWMKVSGVIDDKTSGPSYHRWVNTDGYRKLKSILSEHSLDIEDMEGFFMYPPKNKDGNDITNYQLNDLYKHLVDSGYVYDEDDIYESTDFGWADSIEIPTVDRVREALRGSRYSLDVRDGEATIKELKGDHVWEFDPDITYSQFLEELGNFYKEYSSRFNDFDYTVDLYGYFEDEHLSESTDFGWVDDVKPSPNYQGHPQGVVHLKSHDEINEFFKIIGSVGYLDRNQVSEEVHESLEYSISQQQDVQDYAGVVDYVYRPSTTVSFFISKKDPTKYDVGFWNDSIGDEEVNEWLDDYGCEIVIDCDNWKVYTDISQIRSLFNGVNENFDWAEDIPQLGDYRFFEIYACYNMFREEGECGVGNSSFIKIPKEEVPDGWEYNDKDGPINTGHGIGPEDIVEWSINNGYFDEHDFNYVDYVYELNKDDFCRSWGNHTNDREDNLLCKPKSTNILESDFDWVGDIEAYDLLKWVEPIPEYNELGETMIDGQGEIWVDVSKYSVKQQKTILSNIKKGLSGKVSIEFSEDLLSVRGKSFVVHCGHEYYDYIPTKNCICYFNDSSYVEQSHEYPRMKYVDGSNFLNGEELNESDFDWVLDVTSTDYPIELGILIDYFGYSEVNPKRAMDIGVEVGPYGFECYTLNNDRVWCVTTEPDADKALYDHWYEKGEGSLGEDNGYNLEGYVTISDGDVETYIRTESEEFVYGNLAYHSDDEDNLSNLLEELGLEEESEDYTVDDIPELVEDAITNREEYLRDEIDYHGDLFTYFSREYGFNYGQVTRFINASVDLEQFASDWSSDSYYDELLGWDVEETKVNDTKYILLRYE